MTSISRRGLCAGAASVLLTGCAAVPTVKGLTGADVGLKPGPAHADPTVVPKTQDEPDALQQQVDIQRALDASPLVAGNAIQLLPSGRTTLRAMFHAMRSARRSINMEYFILDDVVSDGIPLSSVLLERLRAGVSVNISHDAFGSRDTPDAFFEELRQAGANVIAFNPLNPFAARAGWAPNNRDHRKLMVVDGRIGFTGGVNLSKSYENPPSDGRPDDGDPNRAWWRDVAVRIEGPAVAELQKLFLGAWERQEGPPPDLAHDFPPLPRAGVQTIRIIGSSPTENQPLYYASLLAAIRSARQRVWLCSGYFVPPHEEREALRDAARAGRDVRIIAPAFTDVEAAVYAGRAAYGDLLEVGTRIYEVRDGVLHAKLAVVDDTWTVIGSSNLDRRSVVFNNEVDAVILGHDAAAQVESVLRGFMADAAPVTLEAWRERPFGERLQEIRARVWQYWM